jgi:hypothetical protein
VKTTADSWNAIALRLPMFVGVADLIEQIPNVETRSTWPTSEELNACFASQFARVKVAITTAEKKKPARHVDGTLVVSSLYEVQIAQQGVIPTRPNNLHDFLNALMWAAMPLSKAALTAAVANIQMLRSHGRLSLPVARSRVHDRLALVDEGGAIVFGDHGQTFIFGHAILQHAYLDLPSVRCAVVRVNPLDAAPTREQLDQALAPILSSEASLAAALDSGAGVYVPTANLHSWVD